MGPVWKGGGNGEEALLRSCYKNALAIAKERGFESVAFPLISAGVYGYPKEQALKIAAGEITAFLLENDMLVYIVIYDKPSYLIGEKLFNDIAAYIDDRYVEDHFTPERRNIQPNMFRFETGAALPDVMLQGEEPPKAKAAPPAVKSVSLDEAVRRLDESFSQMLLRKIDEKGMTDAECYKRANIDRKLFSKIRGDVHYRPKKITAIAFAVALELSLDETKELLLKAGYALSHSNRFDIIIEYFIENGNYDIYEINEALFQFDQALLGA